MGVGLKRSNYERVLLQLYLRKYKGDEPMMGFSKSHYPGCEWVTERQRMPIIMPDSTPPSLISCNACLFRKRYMISVVCNPLKEGWPNEHECDLCDYGWDCETWIRVEGAGELVEQVLQIRWPDAEHPVTWRDLGLVPFVSEEQNSIRFKTQTELLMFRNSVPPYMLAISK